MLSSDHRRQSCFARIGFAQTNGREIDSAQVITTKVSVHRIDATSPTTSIRAVTGSRNKALRASD